MVKTDCVLRFKLTMTSDRVVGDTGIVKYIVAPPNYEQIVLLNEESQNYYKTAIGENHYGKVIKLGELIYASHGDLKDSDLDQFLQSM